jgi:hypothetical protein
LTTRAADHLSANLPEGELQGGLAWHSVITLPPLGSKRQQTLFDIGSLDGPLRLTIFLSDSDDLSVRLHSGRKIPVQIAVGDLFEGVERNQHVHIGAELEIADNRYVLSLYYQGRLVASGHFEGRVAPQMSGGVSYGEGLDGSHHVISFHLALIWFWVRPLTEDERRELWSGIKEKVKETLAKAGVPDDGG